MPFSAVCGAFWLRACCCPVFTIVNEDRYHMSIMVYYFESARGAWLVVHLKYATVLARLHRHESPAFYQA